MRALLEHHGFKVIEAVDGREALDKTKSERPDIVLMDVSMPEMNGIEATRAIREHEAVTGVHVPIISITAHGEEFRTAALAAGCDETMQKPIRIANLLPLLEKLLSLCCLAF